MRIAIIIAILGLSACSMTPTQKKWAGFAAGVLAVGAIAAHDAGSGKPLTNASVGGGLPCHPQPDGSCR